MRRFISYILASLTIFLGIGVSFKPVATRINADLSYRNGNTISFRLDERENGKKFDEDDKAAKNYAAIMETRLESYGVADYKINIKGNRYIDVTLTADNKVEYENIGKLLAVNPAIEISNLTKANNAETIQEIHVKDNEKASWHSNEAYLKFDGTTSIVVMPIPSAFQSDIDLLIKEAEKFEKEKKSNDEKQTPNSIVLWMNRGETDEYAKKDDPIVKTRIIYDQMNSTNFFYGDGKNAFQIRFTPSSSKVSDISDSYKSALYYMNMLNSSLTDYDCKVTNMVVASAAIENLLIYGDHVHIAISATSISLLVGFALICLILALFYRLSAVAIISASSLTTFLAFTLFVIFKPVFSVASLVGLISIFAASVFVGILYNNYLHEEVYKGRSLKKANFEASKKTTLVTVDVSVISMLLGICVYFIGGKIFASAGVLFIIFSLINLLTNTFLLKGLMWLLTNNTSTQKQYKLLGIDEKKVPDLAKQEKQTYFGPYANTNFTKKKKLSAIIFATLTVASTVGMIVFAATKGDVFNADNYYATSNIYHLVLKTDSENEPTSTTELKESLNKIKKDDQDLKYNTEIDTYHYIDYEKTTTETQKHYHYVYEIKILETDVTSKVYSFNGSEKEDLSYALTAAFEKFSSTAVVPLNESLITSQTYNLPGNIGFIFAATSITIVTSSLYLWIRRYRLSRVIPLAAISIAGGIITLGVITLTRIPATPMMAISIATTTLYTLLVGQYLTHKEKDILRDERLKNIETRKAALTKALGMSSLPIISFGIVAEFGVLTCLALASKSIATAFFGSSIGIASSTIMLLTLFTPIADYLDARLSKIKVPEIKLKKKKKVKVKSNEPEEAIFIGIND